MVAPFVLFFISHTFFALIFHDSVTQETPISNAWGFELLSMELGWLYFVGHMEEGLRITPHTLLLKYYPFLTLQTGKLEAQAGLMTCLKPFGVRTGSSWMPVLQSGFSSESLPVSA